jgi:RNA polymerase sigma-70 factor (ECF subfamily)
MGRAASRRDDGAVADELLLSGMAIGDDRASIELIRRYQRRVFGLAVGIVGDPSVAEDVAQEAFLRVFSHAEAFDPRRGAVSTWVLTITRNLAIDALRARRAAPADPDDQVFLELVSTEPLPDDGAITAEAVGRVRAAIAMLPVEQRRAVLLAAMHGWSAAEIASAEAIPLGTAKGRIRLGMAKLRVSLEVGAR